MSHPIITFSCYNTNHGSYTRYSSVGWEILFDSYAKTWLVCKNGRYPDYASPAIVFHAFARGTNTPSYGQWLGDKISTNLPDPYIHIDSAQSEVLIWARRPQDLEASVSKYYARAEWESWNSSGYEGQITIDNYLMRYTGEVIWRDFMQQFCYTKGSDGGSLWDNRHGIYSCP